MGRVVKRDSQDTAPRDLGRYRLHGELASGGMATVHFGRQVGGGGFAKTVAIKRLHPQFAKIPEFVAMFMAEARLAARIRHPNVVQPLDVLQLDEEIFLVMEYIEGDSLSRLMKATVARKERVAVHTGVAIMCGVLHGLHAAHEAKSDRGEPLGIVHRDVSPQNILVGVDGVARVIDFGIAKAADSVQITREGELKGKLSYMSPEQLNGTKVTRKIDIYAASVVLWEALTGQRLFDADYQSAVLKNILHRPVDPPSEIAHDIPRDLDAIVLKGLAKEPDERWATAREMALALEERIVLANPSQIGAWVERVASMSLATRSARVAEIEAVPSSQLAVEDRAEQVVSDMILLDPGDAKTDPTRSWKRTGKEPPPPSRTGASSVPLRAAEPAPRSAPPASLAPRSEPLVPEQVGSRPPPPTINVPDGPLVAPEWPVPGIAPAPPEALTAPAESKKGGGGSIVVILLVIAAATAGFYWYLPDFVRRGYVASAAREGITLSIDQVEVGARKIHLSGLAASAAEVPGVVVRAQSVDLELRGFNPVAMTVGNLLVTIDGSYATVREAVSAYMTSHATQDERKGPLARLEVDSAHLLWRRPFGEATTVEAENVTASAERQEPHALGEDLNVEAPLVTLGTAEGKAGPWRLKLHRDGPTVRAGLGLDPLGTSGAQANLVVYDGAVQALEARVPHVPMAQIGLPPALFGHKADDAMSAESVLSYAVKSPARVEGHASLTLTSARVNGAPAVAEADLDARIEGDPSAPLDLRDGVLAFGPFRGKLTGSVSIARDSVKADIAWKSAALRCASGGDQVVTGTVKLDTHNLDSGALTLVPNIKCGLKLFPP